MRYLLVVGFYCEIYKREPIAKIFLGDKLLDEFHISQHSDTFTDSFYKKLKTNTLQSHIREKRLTHKLKNLPKLRFYEIEIDKVINKLSLRINIENNDNNYSNGFMTKNTTIILQVCNFFPFDGKKLSKLYQIIKKKMLTEKFAWYYNMKSEIFDLRYALKWIGHNNKILKNICTYGISFKIGGDGNFVCNLKKKYGILTHKIEKPNRMYFSKSFIDHLLHKYLYANQ